MFLNKFRIINHLLILLQSSSYDFGIGNNYQQLRKIYILFFRNRGDERKIWKEGVKGLSVKIGECHMRKLYFVLVYRKVIFKHQKSIFKIAVGRVGTFIFVVNIKELELGGDWKKKKIYIHKKRKCVDIFPKDWYFMLKSFAESFFHRFTFIFPLFFFLI